MVLVYNLCPISILGVKLMETNGIFAKRAKLFIKKESTIIL